jgi:DNA-binding response OmpR family regulator
VSALVWIVEDNDQNYELAEFLPEEDGFAVRRARDGCELDLLLGEVGEAGPAPGATAPPSLVLLDMHLPGTSGEELLRRLRRHAGLEATPVVALTAHALRGDRERFLRLGCDGYLAKPIDIKSFVGEVRRHLRDGDGGGRR